jgi:hypothetical protein
MYKAAKDEQFTDSGGCGRKSMFMSRNGDGDGPDGGAFLLRRVGDKRFRCHADHRCWEQEMER